MGFALAASAGIVGLALSAAGFAATFGYFDAQAKLQEAEAEGARIDHDHLTGSIAILSVVRQGAIVTITATNTGAATLDVSDVELLVNGVPRTSGVTRQVEARTTDVWPPATDLTFRFNAAMPLRVAVTTGLGTSAYWGA